MGQLKPYHASLVNTSWEHGGSKEEEDRIQAQICVLPSICIYNGKGEPVSWNNWNFNGSSGIGKIKCFLSVNNM